MKNEKKPSTHITRREALKRWESWASTSRPPWLC